MATPELQFQIALTMLPSIGPVTARKLISHFGSASAIFGATPEQLSMFNRIGPLLSRYGRSAEVMDRAGKEMDFLVRHRISALYFEDARYPRRLNLCHDGPVLLYARGEQGINPARCLSVVGTRRATSYGKDLCRELVMGLARLVPDLVVVSGLAFGIDVMAHRAALESGLLTVAVLGHGLSTLYPASHRDTARRIIGQGALVTDFDSQMGPERNNFLRRNRIIAGMADGTLVVESAEKGGALITAAMASSYNRDVLAVPGRAGDRHSAGCNQLIRRNLAALTQTPEDILRHLNWEMPEQPQTVPGVGLEMTIQEKKLLRSIESLPGIDPASLSHLTGIPVQHVLALLLEMELKDWVSVEPGNRYRTKVSLQEE
jgi:DNA processing protein